MIRQILIDIVNKINSNRGKFLGALVGCLVGVMILFIGLFKTMFIFICTGIGYTLGGIDYKNIDLKELLEKILPPGGIS